MKNLSYLKDKKQIRIENIKAAKEHNIYEIIMEIGEVYFRSNPVTKWNDRDLEAKHLVFSDRNCFGFNCGENYSNGWRNNKNNNPEMIHIAGYIQINPIDKTLNFFYEDDLSTPEYNYDELKEIENLLNKIGYKFGTTNSFLVGA